MSPEFDEAFTDLARLAGVVCSLRPDSHERFGVYQGMLTDSTGRSAMERCLGLEPDEALATSVLAALLEQVAGAGRQRLVDLAPPSGHRFLAERAHDLEVLDHLAGAATSGEVVDRIADRVVAGSDWLQRRAAERSTSEPLLQALAQRGRTRKVRTLSRARLGAVDG